MLKGAYSDKFKSIQKERLEKFKEEQKDSLKSRSDRTKELSKETNRRRKALEERKKELQNNEEQLRDEVLSKRKQEQQEATQRFQKDSLQKKALKQHDLVNGYNKEPVSVVRDGHYVVRGHVVEVKDGKQVPRSAAVDSKRLHEVGLEVWGDEMPDNYDFERTYKDLSYNRANSGILYAMNEEVAQPLYYETDGMENGPVGDSWTLAQQEKFRADAIAKSGPKLAFTKDESQKDPPEGALPCIMGRDSPGGSVTSLDSLDEVPQVAGSGIERELGATSRTGIMAKRSKEVKSAGKRRVTFSDSIEFDDGVTGQLVTEEKQSTKVYTMLFARNANNFYNTSISNSSSSAGHSGTNHKGNKSAGTHVTSVNEKRTEQSPTSSVPSVVKTFEKDSSVVATFGRDSSVATVTHCDHPRPRPVPLDIQANKPEKMPVQVSSSELNSVKDSGEASHVADAMCDSELNDSLEVVKDSLDVKVDRAEDVHGLKDEGDKTCPASSSENWTSSFSTSMMKDSLQRYVESTAEIPTEEFAEKFPSNEDRVAEEIPVYSEPVHVTETPVVTSEYQHHRPFHNTEINSVTTYPYYHRLSSQVAGGVQFPAQGTFHPSFPYPFYTTVGSALMEEPEKHGIENTPVSKSSHTTTTNFGNVQHALNPSDHQRRPATESVVPSSSKVTHAANTGHAFSSQANDIPNKPASTEWVVNINEADKMSSQKKVASSPSSTASTSPSGVKSTRSFIPRPPSTKKSGKSRLHPSGLHRKQTSARPRKGIHNHSIVSDRSQAERNLKASANRKNSPVERATEKPNLETKRLESKDGKEKAYFKQPNNGNKRNASNQDGIMESIKRNMEMMNLRTRTTAAQEQHQRILNSLRLEFGDGKKVQQESVHYGVESHEDLMHAIEHHTNTQDRAARKVHHPRIGSAGSRNGARLSAGTSVKLDLVDDGSYQAGFDGYPNRGKPDVKRAMPFQTVTSGATKEMMQKASSGMVTNQQFTEEERRYEYHASTVGEPTTTTITSQEGEGPLQARTSTRYERDDTGVKRSISLDKTPTDEEINHLWAHVRSYLHGGNTKSVGSDSCVDKVNVRRSRTRSSSTRQVHNPQVVPQQNPSGSRQPNGQHLGVPPQTGGSTLGGLRRYGSHEVLRRDSSSDSLSLKRSPLLQHRASRSRRPQIHAHGQNSRPPLPRPHEYNPSPSQAGPTASVSYRVPGPQPLSPAEMHAVMMASEKEMFHNNQQNAFADISPRQQYQAMMSGTTGPSALSLEEQRLLQSLDRLNERLKAQEEVTKAITQKPRMNDSVFRGPQQSSAGPGTRRTQTNQNSTARNFLHTR